MGTRNLTFVVSKSKIKVAQYGQWDGYPTGQGRELAEFVQSSAFDVADLRKKVDALKVYSDKQVEAAWEAVGAKGDYATMAHGEALEKTNPELSRNTGAKVVALIAQGLVTRVQLDTKFAADSLFCEWAYVLDLDTETVEVYRGFNKAPLAPTERFAFLAKAGTDYHPVRLVGSYTFATFTFAEMEALEERLQKQDEVEEVALVAALPKPKKVRAPRRMSPAQIIKEVYSKPKTKKSRAKAPARAAAAPAPLALVSAPADELATLERLHADASPEAESGLRDAVNAVRAARGMSPLRTDADVVEELAAEVHALFRIGGEGRKLTMEAAVARVLDRANVGALRETRRDHDGVSQTDWLVEKMIGEMLINGRVNG